MGVNLRAEISEYANSVLGVIKEKFRLKDKSEAINKFCELYGEDFVEKQVDEQVTRELINTCEAHFKKYKHKKMSVQELDQLCGM